MLDDKEKLDSIDVEFNKKNRVTAAQFASKEAIANTPRSLRLDGIITRPSHKSQEDGSKVTAEQKDLSNSYKQQERDSDGNTEKVGKAVNKPTQQCEGR